MPCPCGLRAAYPQCCGGYISGAKTPKIAVQLMRSRFSAYSLDNMNYIEATCSGPALATFEKRRGKKSGAQPEWVDLEILSTKDGLAHHEQGWVEFVARYRDKSGIHALHELSEFKRIDGRWFYFDGQHFESS